MQYVAVAGVARIFLLINSLFLFACQDTSSKAESRDFALQQPGAPQSVSASTNNGVVTLSWQVRWLLRQPPIIFTLIRPLM